MIPPPKLDDRSFHDIVEEAISMIPRYAPEWTNHNPSDPGITLIELAAWMTDLLIYRLNQVPDKNYVAFLNLLGIKLRAPRAAKALSRFTLVEGAAEAARSARHAGRRRRRRPRRTRSRSRPRATCMVTTARPDRCFSYFDESYAENSRYIDPRPARGARRSRCSPARSASSASCISSDPRFANAAMRRCCASSSARPRPAAATWRACSSGSTGTARAGRRWSPRRSTSIAARSAFMGPLRFEPTTVNHIEGLWMRGRLAEVPRVAGGHRDRHDPRAGRGRRRGHAADAGVREPRQQRVPPARPVEEHLSVRQGAEGRLPAVPRVRRAAADAPTRTSRSRWCSPTRR